MKEKYSTVSLIISTYNWPEALEVCLMSIAQQTIMPDEVLVADDGSGKETIDLVRRMQKEMPFPIVHVWHEDNGFQLAQIRNKAIVKSSCEYIIQIDGDVILNKHFVEDHLHMVMKDHYIAGSRVMTSQELTDRILLEKKTDTTPLTKGVRHFFNSLRFTPLTSYYKFRYKSYDPYYGKGCNISFWKDDLVKVNGYNEDMTGWGKEDSELIVRLINAGVRKQYMKFGGVAYHLKHTLKSREREIINTAYFNKAIEEKTTWVDNGLNKYL